jgi:predicted metal-dependent phosphoesterase TrpH
VLGRCARGGLDVVALTDHDLASPLAPGPREIEGRVVHLLAGAEVSGMHDGREHHLLVYFPREAPAAFREFCTRQCRARTVRYQRALDALGLAGPQPDPAAHAGHRALTRLHLAHALIDAGIVRNRSEAFARFLGDEHGQVEPIGLTFVDAIRFAREHGGLTSWAHPSRPDVQKHLDTFVAAGLQGLEGLRPQLSSDDRKFFRKAATRCGIYLTGGSDWHGWSASEPGLFRVNAADIRAFVDALLAA